MPVIQPTIVGRFSHMSPSLRRFLYRFSFKSSGFSKAPEGSDPKPNSTPYLETRILDGAHGNGRFMSTTSRMPTAFRSKDDSHVESHMVPEEWGAPRDNTTTKSSWFRSSSFSPWGGWGLTSHDWSADESRATITHPRDTTWPKPGHLESIIEMTPTEATRASTDVQEVGRAV